VSLFIFAEPTALFSFQPLAYTVFPLVIWSALRFGQPAAVCRRGAGGTGGSAMNLDERARELGYRDYKDYIHSKHWRGLVRRYRRKRCYCCSRAKELQLHHITYVRLGGEQRGDLVTLCDWCHSQVHQMVHNGQHKLHKAHIVLRRRVLLRRGKQKGRVR
jgi:hypothetical protein